MQQHFWEFWFSGTGQTLEIDSIETDIYAKRALTLVDTLGKGEAAMLEGSFGTW